MPEEWVDLKPNKDEDRKPNNKFLGATIGNSTIKLQAHIISKVADFKEEELKTTKWLRSWLGLLNYARSYIPNLGKTLGPLYSKTSPNGERRMNAQDWHLIRKVKTMVKNLPDLTIPPEKCFVIIETDGCMDGWGGILKWKQQKYDSKASEQISAYASGKFSPPKSTIDAEIHAVMNSLNSFKIYYPDKEELLIRTDYERPSGYSPSRKRFKGNEREAQSSSNPISDRSYQFLAQYESLSGGNGPWACTTQEKDLRSHLADIEWTVGQHALDHIWELKLILDSKEQDFTQRSQLTRGLHLYYADALPEVIATKRELLNAFIHIQSVIQRIRDTPP
ncbi:hypothetical protein ZIOFF_017027 [Zingiber officinale]|uniref:Reverse transcriptase/retrotransposon-derived protein RNase H-like domain-containing protein n=1 Tax=Zingiber officinale TaxID=94328 RepID=A0A8J5HE89_ZINOF|nr:hypothetical protein ZIOFF_017027 [Zingiber officinale]